MALANFSEAASTGFATGQKMAEGQNPLGNFIKMMLANRQEIQTSQREYGMKTALQQQELSGQKELLTQKLVGEKELFGQKANVLLDIAKIKAKTTVPKEISDTQKFKLALWKQAEQESFKESGGSFMVGIGSKKINYQKRKEELYQEKLKQFGISDTNIPQETQGINDIMPQQQTTDLMDYEW